MPISTIISLALSAIAIILSTIALVYAHKKYKMQRYEFNLDRESEKRAVLIASAEPLGHGMFKIAISNIGKAEARNIVCNFDNDTFEGFYVYGESQLPYPSVKPHEEMKLKVCRDSSRSVCFVFRVSWDDIFKNGNSSFLAVSLL